MGTNHDPVFAVDVQQQTVMILYQLFNFAMSFVMKIEISFFQILPNRPIADNKSLTFHEFLFIAAMAACKSIACAHNSIKLIISYLFDDSENTVKSFLFVYRSVFSSIHKIKAFTK